MSLRTTLSKVKRKLTHSAKGIGSPAKDAGKKDSIKPAKPKNPKGDPYIRKVAEAAGWTYDEAREKMKVAKDQLGVPYKAYYDMEFYNRTRSQQERRASGYLREVEKEKRILKRIRKESRMSPKEVRE